MKTKLLQAVSIAHQPEFFEDLRQLLASDQQELIRACLSWTNAYVAAASDAEREKLISQVALNADADASLVRSTLAFLPSLRSEAGKGMLKIPLQTNSVKTCKRWRTNRTFGHFTIVK
jgi:hypothetical protein